MFFCFLLLDQKKEPEPDTESEEQLRAFLAENFDNKPTEKNSGTGEFKPFPRDPAKQKRYEQYLVCVQNGRGKIALKILQVNNFEKVLFFQHFIEKIGIFFTAIPVMEFRVRKKLVRLFLRICYVQRILYYQLK